MISDFNFNVGNEIGKITSKFIYLEHSDLLGEQWQREKKIKKKQKRVK
jgi:hypothetical protein